MVRLGCGSGEGFQAPVMFARTYFSTGNTNEYNNTQTSILESWINWSLFSVSNQESVMAKYHRAKHMSTSLLGRST
jgi:hypothetical protein